MTEHTESAFYYGNSSLMRFYEHREFMREFMIIENSQNYITNELVPDRIKETARKKLKSSSTSKKVKHNKGNSQ